MLELKNLRAWIFDHLASLTGLPTFDSVLEPQSRYPCLRFALEPLGESMIFSDNKPSLQLIVDAYFQDASPEEVNKLAKIVAEIFSNQERIFWPKFRFRFGPASIGQSYFHDQLRATTVRITIPVFVAEP